MAVIRTKFTGKAKYCYFYLITNLSNGKQYVGSRFTNGKYPLEDNYMGSSNYLKRDIKNLGRGRFTKVILSHERFVDRKTLDKRESYFMHKFNTFSPNGYNRYDTKEHLGFNVSGIPMSEESKEKRRKNYLKKTGYNYPSQNPNIKKTFQKRINQYTEQGKYICTFPSRTDAEKYLGVSLISNVNSDCRISHGFFWRLDDGGHQDIIVYFPEKMKNKCKSKHPYSYKPSKFIKL